MKEKFSTVIDMDDLVEEKNQEAEERSETRELNIVDIEAEEEDKAEDDGNEEIENAKKYREKKRKLNSGEYISMTKENADLEEAAANAEKNRIQQRILNQKDKSQKPKNEDDLDLEEEEELEKWQNKILKNTISSSIEFEIS